MAVTTAAQGNKRRNDRSNSSASATTHSLLASSTRLLLKLREMPPRNALQPGPAFAHEMSYHGRHGGLSMCPGNRDGFLVCVL